MRCQLLGRTVAVGAAAGETVVWTLSHRQPRAYGLLEQLPHHCYCQDLSQRWTQATCENRDILLRDLLTSACLSPSFHPLSLCSSTLPSEWSHTTNIKMLFCIRRFLTSRVHPVLSYKNLLIIPSTVEHTMGQCHHTTSW